MNEHFYTLSLTNSKKANIFSFAKLFNGLLLIASIIIAVVPDLNRYFPKSIWTIILVAWYLSFFYLLLAKQASLKIRTFLLSLFAFFGLQLFYRVVGYSSASIGNYFLMIVHYDLIIKSLFVLENYCYRNRVLIWRLLQTIILILIVLNIYWGLVLDRPHFLIFYYPESYVGKNIAQTEFYNMLVFYVGICLFSLFRAKRIVQKLFDIFCIITALYFIVFFETRVTCLFFSLLALFLGFACSLKKLTSRIAVMIVTISVVSLFVLYLGSSLPSFLPERVAVRMEAIADSIYGGSEESEYLQRFKLVGNSLSTFLASPINMIFGTGYHLGDEYYGIIGQHSFFTDVLVAYGTIGFILLLFYLTSLFQIFTSKNNGDVLSIRYFSYMFFVFVLVSIFSNSFTPQNSFSFFFCFALLSKKEERFFL